MRGFLDSMRCRLKVQIANNTNRAMKTSQGRFVQFTPMLVAALSPLLTQPAEAASWVTNGPMVTVHFDHTATLLPDGRVLVAGGRDAYGSLFTAELYDP